MRIKIFILLAAGILLLAGMPAGASGLDGLKVVYVKKGFKSEEHLSWKGYQEIEIDGYVSELVFFTKSKNEPLVLINSKQKENISLPFIDGNRKLYITGQYERSPSNIFKIAQPSSFADILTEDECLEISYFNGKEASVIVLKQKAKIEKLALESGGRKVNFRLIGDCRLEKAKLDSIINGIKEVESHFGLSLDLTVDIIEFSNTENAFAAEKRIIFFCDVLNLVSGREAQAIAEHEALHIASRAWRLMENNEVRTLYCDLLGVGPEDYARRFLLMYGLLPVGSDYSKSMDPFFRFINESSYLSQGNFKNFGHSQDDPSEFCVSFLHSQMHTGLLRAELKASAGLNGIYQNFSRIVARHRAANSH